MRTKVLLCAAALAASLASSMAQNVYSLNVVGYVNVTLPSTQFYAVANPLDATMGGTVAGANDIGALFNTSTTGGTIAGGSSIATFNSAAFDFNTSIAYSGKSGTWGGSLTMNPGLGALYFNAGASPTVVTFVGQVQQGSYNVATLPSTQFSLIGAPVPVGGDVSNLNTLLGLAPRGGDSIATFNSAAFDWNPSVAWSAKSSAWGSALPINPGQAALYFNASGTANAWVSNFTVQ